MAVHFDLDPSVCVPCNAPRLSLHGLQDVQRALSILSGGGWSSASLASLSCRPLVAHRSSGHSGGHVFEFATLSVRGRKPPPFASSLQAILETRRNVRLERLIQDIVRADGPKDYVEESDLLAFAEREHLPTSYVPYFLQSASQQSNVSTQQNKTQKVSLHRFKTFLESREASLRLAFDAFDADGNGYLTVEEVKDGLGSFRFSCPETRCNYRCKKEVVSRILGDLKGTIAQTRRPGISFDEFRSFFMLLPRNEMLVDYFISARCPAICDIGACAVVARDPNPKGSPWGHLLAGAAAGAVSRTATAPLETLRLQAMAAPQASGAPLLARAQGLVKAGGWKALYAGNAVNVLKSAPQKALDFFWFDLFKGLLRAKGTGPATFAAAGAAGAASTALMYPLEVVRSRLTVTPGRYPGPRAALRQIVATEGFGALYRGLPASVASIVPEAAITYGLFDALKRAYTRVTGVPETPPMQALAFGVFSAFCGQMVAFPLETVARRMQMGSSGSAQALVAEILSRGGPGALYQGIGAASLRVLPMAVASFGTYELVRSALSNSQLGPPRSAACRAKLEIEPI